MSKLKSIILLSLSVILFSCQSENKVDLTTVSDDISKIEVIDFHSTHRCMTCNAIEANTRYTLETYFAEELKSEKITLQVLNVDEPENEGVAQKFEASGTSLFVNVVHNGQESKIDLTEFAFMNGNDQKEFSEGLKSTIEQELKSL